MNELIEALKKALADTYAFSVKSQNYHWNVEGDDFPMYHEFFGNLYEEVHGAIDTIAELIRTLDEYSPGSFKAFQQYTTIADETSNPDSDGMIRTLYSDNQAVLRTLMDVYGKAEKFSEFGVSNYIQDRIQAHKKHAWMLRSMLKGDE